MRDNGGKTARSDTLIGIAMAAGAYFFFALHDATVKWLVADYSVWQIMFVRSLIIVIWLAAFHGRPVFAAAVTSRYRLHLLWRAVVVMAAWLCYFSAARNLGLAEMMTLYYSSPILVAALAIPLLGERIPAIRWIAIFVGFAGVTIACRPGHVEEPWPVILVLIAAACWAYATIIIRQIRQVTTTAEQMAVANVWFVVVCGATLPWQWHQPDLVDAGLLLLVGALGTIGQRLLFDCIRRAPSSVVAPLEFSGLAWAFGLGYVLWGDVPDIAVVVGAALILISGFCILLTEWWGAKRI